MKSLLALCAIGLLGVYAGACGGASKGTASHVPSTTTTIASSTSATSDYTKADSDRDNDGVGGPDGDTNNNGVLDFGHAANASDMRSITTLVQRYYAAAAAEDGAKACSMLYSTLAETVPEDYGTSPPGPAYARGTTCPAVMTLIFKHAHDKIATKFSKLRVSRVRLKEHRGLAVLTFSGMPEREISVAREGHIWRITALLDSELP
jgi:hypothetical protein